MAHIEGAKVMILATDGFEQSELEVPARKLEEAGAIVHVVSPEDGEITGWDRKDWGSAVPVDRPLSSIDHNQYDILVLPGGQINPDTLRANGEAVDVVRNFGRSGRIVAAICHAPWLLIEAGLVKGREVTGYPSIRTDLRNAGGNVKNEPVVVDGNIITSRNPDDLDAFCKAIVEQAEHGNGRVPGPDSHGKWEHAG